MAITLKFFMIKRGLTVEKMALKSNAKTPDDLVNYAKSLNIGVTAADEVMIRDYYASLAAENIPPDQVEIPASPVHEGDKPVLEKKKRGKKSVGKDV